MTNAIVYSSQTGNTKLLAETIREALPGNSLVYFGTPGEEALKADRIYVGFWTDKGSCSQETGNFLKTLTDQQVYLFGTAGFGESQDYFDKVLKRTEKFLPRGVRLVGSFMCQGKMPMTVRQRYEKMMHSPVKVPNLQGMIENFDKALRHPDPEDLRRLGQSIQMLNSET